MADLEKSVEDLEKEITCAICHEHYTEPKVLSCCHYYCKQCIHTLALRTGLDKPFPCPECRKDTTLPQGSMDNLQAAFFINRMKEVHSKLQRVTGKVEAKCEACSGAQAEAFCRQCAMFICAECVKQHQRMKIFTGHKISSFEELKGGGAKEFVIQEPKFTCKLHDEPMKTYCFDCNSLICRDCCMEDHAKHTFKSIATAVPNTRKKLTQHLKPLRKARGKLASAMEEIHTIESEIKVQGQSVASHIENSFDKLHHIIEHRKLELLEEVAEKKAYKLERLSNQEKTLSTACAVVQSVIDYTEQCIEHSADGEIMCMHAELQSRIDREMKEQQEIKGNLDPVEEADIIAEVSCVEELKKLCQTKANISQLPPQYTMSGLQQQNVEIGCMSEVKLKGTTKVNGRLTERTVVTESYLKSLVEGSTTALQVEPIGKDEYRIQYTPTVRGRHELTITVNGQEVAGSPFPVFVSIRPTQLDRPVRVISGLNDPRHVTVNSKGEAVVLDSQALSTFDYDGKKLLGSSLSNYNISNPHGMALDLTDGSIYVTDNDSRKIVKLSPDLQLLCEVKLGEGSQPRGVTVVGEEVMVCDRDSCLMVYTKELKYVKQIASHGDGPGQVGSWLDISSDEHGILYVADMDKSCIHVFSQAGSFLRSFGHSQLNAPSGVCVCGQYVYVANYWGHNITVFTTEGEIITALSGKIRNPWGVCVDKNTFVYVCDQSNESIKIF